VKALPSRAGVAVVGGMSSVAVVVTGVRQLRIGARGPG
jgi:hypothetical protein